MLKNQHLDCDEYDNGIIKNKPTSINKIDEEKKTIDLDTEIESKRIKDKGQNVLNIELVKR